MLLFILAGSMSARKHQSFVGDREFTSDLHFKDNKTKKKNLPINTVGMHVN